MHKYPSSAITVFTGVTDMCKREEQLEGMALNQIEIKYNADDKRRTSSADNNTIN